MKKKIAVAVLGVMIVIALLIWVYNVIQASHWQEQNNAVKTAREQAGITHVDKVDWFSGDSSYMIVFGRDGENRNAIVWVGKDDVHKEYADAGVAKEEVVQKVKSAFPGCSLVRIVPGVYESEYVWEAYFKANQEENENVYYQYYRFTDGKLLDTLNMLN